MEPAGQDLGAPLAPEINDSTAPMAPECQSFLDNVVAQRHLIAELPRWNHSRETGSMATACLARSSVVLTEISPNPAISPEIGGVLRVGFVSRAPCLELRRLFGPFVSGLKIPFPGNGDLGSKRTRFECVF